MTVMKLNEKTNNEINGLRKLLIKYSEGKIQEGEKIETDDKIKKRLAKLGYM